MARKAKTEKSQEVNQLAKLASEYNETYDYVGENGEAEYTFHIKRHISMAVKSTIIGAVAQLYFDEDGFDPCFGDRATRMLIAQQYTGESFNDDVDVFECIDRMFSLWGQMPYEAFDLYGYIVEKIEYEKKRRAKESDALKAAYDHINKLGESISGVANAAAEFLSKAQDSFEGENIPMSELIDLFKTANKKDEKKIAQAVLDYRAEKAKREAEKV